MDRTKLSGNIGPINATFASYITADAWATLEAVGYFDIDLFKKGDMFYVYNTTTKTGRIYFIDGNNGAPATFYAKKGYGA